MDGTIGDIARMAGVHVETVRYYERIGLLRRPARANRYVRRYPPQALETIRFIKRARWLGFSLQEVGKLLSLAESHHSACSEARDLGQAKLELVRRKLAELDAIRSTLEALLDGCRQRHDAECPLLHALRVKRDGVAGHP